MRKPRREDKFRDTASKDNTFSPHLSNKTAERIVRYCKINNINKTQFVERCCNERLDELETDMLSSFTKEQLIEMVKKNW